jgi:hypothetical protein
VKILLFAVSLAASIPAWQITLATDSEQTSVPDFKTLELKILNAGRQTIGATHFTLSSERSKETIKGEKPGIWMASTTM